MKRAKGHTAVVWSSVAMGLALSLPVTAQTIGWAHSSGQIYKLNLDAGGTEIPWQVSSETALGGISGALVSAGDGSLWATNYWWPNPDSLVKVDPETGDFEILGDFDGGLWADLAVDHEGQLWVATDGSLFEVDYPPLVVTERPIDAPNLLGIATYEGLLYGISRSESETFQLVEIDTTSGETTEIVDLEGFTQTECSAEHPTSMDFDARGGLWVVNLEMHGTCITPFVTNSYVYYEDPFNSGGGVNRHLAPDAPILMTGLAVESGPLPIVEIPVMHPFGAIILVAVLASLGVVTVRRRFSV